MYIWRKRATADWARREGEGLLSRFGPILATIEEAGKARILIQISCRKRSEALRLRREFGGSIEKLPTDWLKQASQLTAAEPLRIGSRLIIARTRDPDHGCVRTIVIPAEAAFGTGEHPTTAMSLRILERVTRNLEPGWSMLDAGTGSGILALAGSCFGADRVLAIDNDPVACATAKRNSAANRLSNIQFQVADVLNLKFRQKFDVITANLFSELLAAALPAWRSCLAPGGCLILSGVLRPQERDLAASLRRNAFATAEVRRRGKWIALRAVRAGKNS